MCRAQLFADTSEGFPLLPSLEETEEENLAQVSPAGAPSLSQGRELQVLLPPEVPCPQGSVP